MTNTIFCNNCGRIIREPDNMNILICDGCGEQILDCTHHIEYENGLVFHNCDCEDKYNRS